MRKTSVIICIFLLFITKAFSQSYIPFVQEGKMWTEFSFADPNYSNISIFTIEGDTIFGTKHYSIIQSQIINIYTELWYLYEDTTNKRVFIYNEYLLQDSLLYDFNKNVGDSFNIGDGFDQYVIVTEKVVEYFAGKNRTKMILSYDGLGSYPDEIWYEGIGNINGVFRPFTFGIVGATLKLLCYFESDTLLYHNTILNEDCFLITETQELQPGNTFDTYFTENILHVTLSKPKTYTLFVYDLFGRKLCQISASGDMEKDFSNLPAGMYLWRVESKGESGVFSGKFLKD